MMRESVQQPWAQDPWPLIDNNNNTLIDATAFDSSSFLNSDQVLQLQDLFGQDELDFDRDTSHLYDEFTFVPETSSTTSSNLVDTIEPSHLTNQSYVDNILNTIVTTEAPILKRRRSSSCTSSSSLSSYSSSSSSSSDEEDEVEDFSSINNSRRYSSSSSDESEAEQEVILPFIHRRQMEEMVLDKITNHLEQEKLPGILTIISTKHEEEQEEVEIDLARLDRDQLERILNYVNACLMEKEGGPKVKLSDYTVQIPTIQQKQQHQREKEAGPTLTSKQQTAASKKRQRRRNNHRKSIVEEGHVVSGGSTLPSRLSSTQGPISMSALTLLEQQESNKKPRKRKSATTKKNKKSGDGSVHMSTNNLNSFKDSIASTKPKRKSAAIHKRRLLEEMLQPSNSEDESEDDGDADNGSGIILFGDERMDLAVTHNETIVHQQQSEEEDSSLIDSIAVEQQIEEQNVEEEDDELIDIMM